MKTDSTARALTGLRESAIRTQTLQCLQNARPYAVIDSLLILLIPIKRVELWELHEVLGELNAQRRVFLSTNRRGDLQANITGAGLAELRRLEDKQIESAKVDPETQYAGCWIGRNNYLRIGLSRDQTRLLKRFSQRVFDPGEQTCARGAWYLLNTALANLELLETLIRKQPRGHFHEDEWDQKARARIESPQLKGAP